jgi:hypothetical protein
MEEWDMPRKFEIHAVKEMRYEKPGVNYWTNIFSHGFYPSGGWMDYDSFMKRYGSHPDYEIIWDEEPQSAYHNIPYSTVEKKWIFKGWK